MTSHEAAKKTGLKNTNTHASCRPWKIALGLGPTSHR